MNKRPTFVEVLNLAADHFLVHNRELYDSDQFHGNRYSCVAIFDAVCALRKLPTSKFDSAELRIDLMNFLVELGLDIHADEDQFSEFLVSRERLNEASQGARFMWLEFVALVAEEEGL